MSEVEESLALCKHRSATMTSVFFHFIVFIINPNTSMTAAARKAINSVPTRSSAGCISQLGQHLLLHPPPCPACDWMLSAEQGNPGNSSHSALRCPGISKPPAHPMGRDVGFRESPSGPSSLGYLRLIEGWIVSSTSLTAPVRNQPTSFCCPSQLVPSSLED